MTIQFYGTRGKYSFLSNFHNAIITLDGHQYATVEHYYQSMKTTDPLIAERVRSCPTPGGAKLSGRQIPCREDWADVVGNATLHAIFEDPKGIVVHRVKDHFMFQGLVAKFTQRPELRDALLLTGTEELIEASPTDFYWGVGKNGTGQNKLGRMLQLVRRDLLNRTGVAFPLS
jgi:ribA/ribD-fused uncharacterized protein